MIWITKILINTNTEPMQIQIMHNETCERNEGTLGESMDALGKKFAKDIEAMAMTIVTIVRQGHDAGQLNKFQTMDKLVDFLKNSSSDIRLAKEIPSNIADGDRGIMREIDKLDKDWQY